MPSTCSRWQAPARPLRWTRPRRPATPSASPPRASCSRPTASSSPVRTRCSSGVRSGRCCPMAASCQRVWSASTGTLTWPCSRWRPRACPWRAWQQRAPCALASGWRRLARPLASNGPSPSASSAPSRACCRVMRAWR